MRSASGSACAAGSPEGRSSSCKWWRPRERWLETRARTTSADLGLAVGLEQDLGGLSGGERARAALAAILLSRFEVLLLDEPTNDLDLDGLDRLEGFLAAFDGALVVVSHDRAFLDRVVTRIASIEPGTRRVREWSGGWSDYAAARDAERTAAYDRYEQAQLRRRELATLLARRRNEARAGGAMRWRQGYTSFVDGVVYPIQLGARRRNTQAGAIALK